MPSTAFIAMRNRNMIGSSRNGQVAADWSATNAPVATDIAAVSTVTPLAVSPALASHPASGRSNPWKRGFRA